MTMRHSLGILLLLAALVGCGSDGGSAAPEADDPESTGDAGWTQVALFSVSEAGGEVGTTATPLPDEAAANAFAGGFEERLSTQVVDAVAHVDVPAGQALYGAVVALDCQPPTEVAVVREADDVVVTPAGPKATGTVQCLVPVTTVALVLVDDADG